MTRIAIAAEIPDRLRDADELLTQYGRWASDRDTARRCGSAERYYRPEGWQAVDARREPKPVGMHIDVAMQCQRALARVPDRERIVLQVLYVPRRLPPEAQLRILRIPPRLSQERHRTGLTMFANLFRVIQCAPPVTATVSRHA